VVPGTITNTTHNPNSNFPGVGFGRFITAIAPDPTDQNGNSLVVGLPGGGAFWTITNGLAWNRMCGGYLSDENVYDLQFDRLPGSSFLFAFGPVTATAISNYRNCSAGPNRVPLDRTGDVNLHPLPINLINPPIGALQGYQPSFGKPANQMLLASSMQHPNGERVLLWAQQCQGLFYTNADTPTAFSAQQTYPFGPPFDSTNVANCIESIASDDTTGYIFVVSFGGGPVYSSKWNSALGAPGPWARVSTGLPNDSMLLVSMPDQPQHLAAVDMGGIAQHFFQTVNDGALWVQAATGAMTGGPSRSLTYGGQQNFFTDTTSSGGAQTAYTLNGGMAPWPQFGVHNPAGNDVQQGDSFAVVTNSLRNKVWVGTGGVPDFAGNAPPYLFTGNLERWTWSPGIAPANGASVPTSFQASSPRFMVAVSSPNNSLGSVRLFTGGDESYELSCSDDYGADWVSEAGLTDFISMQVSGDVAYILSFSGMVRWTGVSSAADCAHFLATQPVSLNLRPTLLSHLRDQSALVVDSANSANVYVVDGNTVWSSSNSGTAWTKNTLPAGVVGTVGYLNGSQLVVGTINSGVYVSSNQGATWAPFALNNGSPTLVMSLLHSSANNGTWFIGTSSGLFRMIGCNTMCTQPDEATGWWPDTASHLDIDPSCPQHIVASFGLGQGYSSGHYPNLRGGVLLSRDDGSSWRNISIGGPVPQNAPFVDVQWDPATKDRVYLAAYGAGTEYFQFNGGALACP
jgi:hypothetical protein